MLACFFTLLSAFFPFFVIIVLMKLLSKLKNASFYWDLFFISSIAGIWPRFIEPKLLFSTRIPLKISSWPSELEGIRVIQISDLHFSDALTDRFLRKIEKRVRAEKPHLILFTGDFICRSKLHNSTRLREFLNSLKASHGHYAVLGNHDYSHYVSINQAGDYDVLEEESTQLNRGIKRFFKKPVLTSKCTDSVKRLTSHAELTQLLKDCKIEVLQNESRNVIINNHSLTIVGLGEHMLNQANPAKAFLSCDPSLPTIAMVHNPDAIPNLSSYSCDLILAGHTHGGQVNLPWLWDKICILENPRYKKGLLRENGKWIYVSRGIAGVTPLRFFSPPEITTFTIAGKQ